MPTSATTCDLHRVGALYQDGRRNWRETVKYQWTAAAGHQLVLFLAHPRRQELEAVSSGSAEFAVAVEDEVLFLLYRFKPGLPWGAAPYAPWVAAGFEAVAAPPLPDGSRTFLQVLLVDAATGLLSTLRMLSFNPAFSAVLEEQLNNQARHLWTTDSFMTRLRGVHARIPDAQGMLPRALAVWRSGQD